MVRSEVPWKSQNIPSFDIFFGRDYAEFLWDTIMETGSKYPITPFGVAARRLIQGSKGMTK
jgi:glycine cleavage system aminomethyltransferase T